MRQLAEQSTHQQRDWEQERFVAVSGSPAVVDGGDSADVDDVRSIRTIVSHELERVEEDDDEVCRARRVELGPPETTSLGMTYLSDDEEDNGQVVTRPNPRPASSVIDELELFQRLTDALGSARIGSGGFRRRCKPSTPLRRTPCRRPNQKYPAPESQVSSTQCPSPVESTPSPRRDII